MTTATPRPRLLSRSTWSETRFVLDALRAETLGGLLLLVAATVALVWANSPWAESYSAIRDGVVGPDAVSFGPVELHLGLTAGHWAADGLLAIFFFVAGIELKRELVVGELRDPRRAAVPVAAALAGVVVPAVLYLGLTWTDPVARTGWAIPTATDIAFALAVLAVIGTHLPTALRAFLLTLAVVDDVVAILIIAVFYSDDVALLPLAAAALPVLAFAWVARRPSSWWWLLVPLGATAWLLVHESGVHATVAGVLLALVLPVRHRTVGGTVEEHSVGERLEHLVRPVSAAVAVPVFALFAAGVTVGGGSLMEAVADPVFAAIVVALVVGKCIGVLGGAWATARFTHAELDDDLAWVDILGLSLLAGIGFTVSLLIGELAFGSGSDRDDHVKLAVLAGSLLAAALAAVVLRLRNRAYRRIWEEETRDDDHDGVPDVFVPQ